MVPVRPLRCPARRRAAHGLPARLLLLLLGAAVGSCRAAAPEVDRTAGPPSAPGRPASAATSAAGSGEEVADPVTPAEALETFEAAWQAIYDTHFDPTFNGVDWVALHDELLPEVEAATTRGELRRILDGMIERLGQSHFAVIPSSSLSSATPDPERERTGTLGLDVRLRDGRVLVTRVDADGSADRAGIRPGWVLVRIGADELDFGDSPADPRSQRMNAWQRVMHRVTGPRGEAVSLAVLDEEDRVHELELLLGPRSEIAHDFNDGLPTFHLRFESHEIPRDGRTIGYFHFTNWFLPMMQPINEAVDRMRGSDGMVIDLRGNTGGAAAMVMGVAGHFFAERTDLGAQRLRESTVKYVAMPQRIGASGKLVNPFAGPVAVLIDETTGSASEVFAGGMQSAGRVRVFGDTSAGAVLPARTTKLPNGDALLHAVGDFETAQGVLLEGRGVIPDEPVPLTRADLLAERDAALEAAIAWILDQLKAGGV